MTRPATFTCTWCGGTKALKRTGRMPRFCSDACRRAPLTAERALKNARYHKASAERAIAYYEEHLARYARLSATCDGGDVGDREPGPDDRPLLDERAGRFEVVNL